MGRQLDGGGFCRDYVVQGSMAMELGMLWSNKTETPQRHLTSCLLKSRAISTDARGLTFKTITVEAKASGMIDNLEAKIQDKNRAFLDWHGLFFALMRLKICRKHRENHHAQSTRNIGNRSALHLPALLQGCMRLRGGRHGCSCVHHDPG